MNIKAEENVMAEVMNLLGVEPAAATPGPNIPALRENLAILVSFFISLILVVKLKDPEALKKELKND